MSTTPSEQPQQSFPAYGTQPPQGQQTGYGHPQPSYGPEPTYAGAYASPKPVPANTTVADVNTYALVSVIVTFIMPIAGIIFGHIGLSQIKRTGDSGRGLALTGLIYGYCVAVVCAVIFVSYVGLLFMLIGSAANDAYYF